MTTWTSEDRENAMKKEDDEPLDEVLDTDEKKMAYAKKASDQIKAYTERGGAYDNSEKGEKDAKGVEKRTKGLQSLVNKIKKKKTNEEVESLDELKKRTYASYVGKAAPEVLGHAYAAGMTNTNDPKTKEKSFRKAFKRVKGIERATKRLAKEEVELISIEESAYLEEMVGKGKLPDILAHHKNNMMYHSKMYDHHNMMADKSEQVGDGRGFDLHIDQSMEHEYQYQHHKNRYDHAVGLKTRSKAQKEMKSASEAMSAASKKVADAKALKREY